MFVNTIINCISVVDCRKLEMVCAFVQMFDRNSDGYISKAELYHTLKELGVNLSLEELNSKMREADSNQDGRIDYAGQCLWLGFE